jgi:hypothetical protein
MLWAGIFCRVMKNKRILNFFMIIKVKENKR